MLETDLMIENAILKDRLRAVEAWAEECSAKLKACNLILEKNAKELPALITKVRLPPWESDE